MSHYFQQLLTSSGLVQSAQPIPSLANGAPSAATDFGEVVAETFVSAPEPSAVLPREIAPQLKFTSEIETTPAAHDFESAPASANFEPGVVEIISPQVTEQIIRPRPIVSVPAIPSVVPASVTPWSESSDHRPESVRPPASSVSAKPSETKSSDSSPDRARSSTVIPSSDELIQHVFRWVAQNPTDLTPPALANSPSAAGKSAASVSQKPSVRPAKAAPAQSAGPHFAPPAAAPQRASTPAQSAPASTGAVESSVEISIGTLQIQVEAPPAPVTKPSRRPTAPRNTGALPAPAVLQRPAIDLNRLRRGFYI